MFFRLHLLIVLLVVAFATAASLVTGSGRSQKSAASLGPDRTQSQSDVGLPTVSGEGEDFLEVLEEGIVVEALEDVIERETDVELPPNDTLKASEEGVAVEPLEDAIGNQSGVKLSTFKGEAKDAPKALEAFEKPIESRESLDSFEDAVEKHKDLTAFLLGPFLENFHLEELEVDASDETFAETELVSVAEDDVFPEGSDAKAPCNRGDVNCPGIETITKEVFSPRSDDAVGVCVDDESNSCDRADHVFEVEADVIDVEEKDAENAESESVFNFLRSLLSWI